MTKKLVIIDDSSTQLNILKTFFINNGWDVCGVQSAKIGYEVIFDFAPDLIITDAIMPLMGGFQLIKMIRENEKISKIPVIVYSILNEAHAKFYIKEELSEYFLRKEDNHDELLELALKVVEKFPLEKEYKDEILRVSLNNYKVSQEPIVQEVTEEEIKEEEIKEVVEEEIFDGEEFEKKIKLASNFDFGDEKIFPNIFSILYDELNYDIAVLSVHSFEDEEKKTYFDIRNVILSPILKNAILNKLNSKLSVLYKKYAPNLATIVNEAEFLSKVEYELEYNLEKIANVAFYSREKLKWENEEKLELIKETLLDFAKTRNVKRKAQNGNKEDILSRYIKPLNKFDNFKNSENMHFGIIQVSNFSDLIQNLSQEDVDIINSRISETIIECLEKNEQVYKNDEDEYDVVIFTKDEKHAKYRLKYILNEIQEITYNTYKLEIFIAACSCNLGGNFNIVEAQKCARKILEESTHQDNVVIYNVR